MRARQSAMMRAHGFTQSGETGLEIFAEARAFGFGNFADPAILKEPECRAEDGEGRHRGPGKQGAPVLKFNAGASEAANHCHRFIKVHVTGRRPVPMIWLRLCKHEG